MIVDEYDVMMFGLAARRGRVSVRQRDGGFREARLVSWGGSGSNRHRARVEFGDGVRFTVRKSQIILPDESS